MQIYLCCVKRCDKKKKKKIFVEDVERREVLVSISVSMCGVSEEDITKTCLYNIDPLKPHFYSVKLGFTGVYIIFLISAQKHRLWVLVWTASLRRF